MAATHGDQIVAAATARVDATLGLLRALVELESPSNEKVAVDRLIDWLQTEIQNRGGQVERLPQEQWGDLLVARFAGTGDAPIQVMTHIDTVWPLGAIERLPWREDGDRIHGPGIYDMKASVAMMLTALDILADTGLDHRQIVWTVNTEEEVGSPVSRSVLERVAREACCVLCLEPPVPPDGSLKTERKGVGMFEMEIEGRASHAGADHQSGVSANEELARQIQRLHALTDYSKGTTVNVGVVAGGSKRNVVAASARAEIDLRTMSELAGRSEAMKELNSFCTVFAKTEIMGWIFEEMPVEDIAKGIYLSVANRIYKIRMEPDLPIYLVGGVIAYHPYFKTILSERFGQEVVIPDHPQFIVSLGAALYARKHAQQPDTVAKADTNEKKERA